MSLIENIKNFFGISKKQKEQVPVDPNKIIDIGYFYPDEKLGTNGNNIFFRYASGRVEIFPFEALRNALTSHSVMGVIYEEKKN